MVSQDRPGAAVAPPRTPSRIDVLLIEDDDGDALIVQELLQDVPATADAPTVRVQRASSLAAAKPLLPRASCVLLDLGLPDATDLDGIRWLQEQVPDMAVVVLTGLANELLGGPVGGAADAGVRAPRRPDVREFADAPRPGLIMLDLNLPRVSGLEVLAELKADPDLRVIPVVVLTTSRAEEDVLRSYSLHANAYVTKPVDFEQFMDAVRQIGSFFVTVVHLPRA